MRDKVIRLIKRKRNLIEEMKNDEQFDSTYIITIKLTNEMFIDDLMDIFNILESEVQ